ncbi:AraC family transcriptional regulator [Ralstonia sp. UBA689]|uniref:AraC family transcriptional regulator n=1 Tax=Ralstonia sp. UBA689 TaxID=1947373 RepID=UPI0025EE4272|nr:AraC family transcriptional regulator [Ralstonia sp. UBA689]
METMVRVRSLNGYFQVVRRLGFNPQEALRQAGLEPAKLADPEQLVPLVATCRLMEVTANNAPCPTLGLQMAEARQELDFGVLGLLLGHKRTLREALQAIIQYRHMLNEALAIYLESDGDMVVIREEVITETPVPLRQANELAVGVLARTCSALLGVHWKPRSVHFTHAAPADVSLHRRVFGCPVVFDSDFNGIVCAAADLETPNPAADPALVRYAESLAEPLNMSGPAAVVQEVRRAVYLLLPLERTSVEEVAEHLHLSVRTLQRQLESAGATFSELVEEVRHNLAIRYMANPSYRIGRVAALLGYTRQASFTRWFVAHFGMTPRAWRGTQSQSQPQ